MKRSRHHLLLVALILILGLVNIAPGLPGFVPGQARGYLSLAQDDGFVPMFNGKDLTGWVNANGAPDTFFVKDNMIITTGKPTGFMRTEKQYENFIMEFEWMHLPANPKAVGNSGLFVWGDPLPAKGTGYTRGIEVQVLVNLELNWATSHGDIFSIWGAKCKPDRPHPTGLERCLPSERVCKGAGEWNHYRVYANDGVIKLTVNGKEVSGVSQCNPRKGYLALESEGSECRFKNLKIKELPSTNPKADEIADVAKNFRPMLTRLNFDGWKADDSHKKHWKTNDGGISYDGAGEADLWTTDAFGDFEMVGEYRFPRKTTALDKLAVRVKNANLNLALPSEGASAEKWHKFTLRLKGNHYTFTLDGKSVVDNAALSSPPERGPIALLNQGEPIQLGNLFIRDLSKED